MPIMADQGKILMATAATADNRELATDCCNATDILIVTCNQNRITDDDYTVKLNGHAVGNVVHVGDSDTGCVSPGDGLWACTDPSIVPGVLTNEDVLSANCSACLEDAAWTMGTLNAAWLAANNELIVTATSNEYCGDWGTVAAWAVDAKNKRLCYPLTSGAYVGLNGPLPCVMFDGTFSWDVSDRAFRRAKARGLGDTVERALDAAGIGPLAKRAIKSITGRPCHCGQRRDWLNNLVPYSTKGKDMATNRTVNNAPQIAALQAYITDGNCQIAAINSAAGVKVAQINIKIANWQTQLTALQTASQSSPVAPPSSGS